VLDARRDKIHAVLGLEDLAAHAGGEELAREGKAECDQRARLAGEVGVELGVPEDCCAGTPV
jgi:hypothetical protein